MVAALTMIRGAAAQTPLSTTCTALTTTSAKSLPNPTTVVTSANWNSAKEAQGNTPALPEHCEVLGKMDERTGTNGQKYAIRFHLRLPARWNGSFFFEGGGGSNGNLGMALGNLQGRQPTNALAWAMQWFRKIPGTITPPTTTRSAAAM